jgi:hypothetical protein
MSDNPTVGRADAAGYFAVNDKPMGVSTSYRVSGRGGELGRRYTLFADANDDCKRLNKAYLIGFKHGLQDTQDKPESGKKK